MPNEFVIKHGFISKGDSIVNGTISGETLNLTTISSNPSLTQVLVRNNTTGVVEYRDASSLSGGSGTNTFVTGTTFGSNQSLTRRNDGADVLILTGGTNVTLSNPSTNQIKIDVSIPAGMNTFVTGFTYNDNNTFTIFDNDGGSFPATISQVSGLTVNGILSATTISGGTFYGDGSNLTGIPHTTDTFISGGTYSDVTDIITFTNTTGGTFNVTGITDTFVTGFTWNPSTFDLTIEQNNGITDEAVNLSVLASDVYVLSGVYNTSTGIVTYTNSTGGTFQVSGFTTGMTDSYTTNAYILSGDTIAFDSNINGTNYYRVDLNPLLSGKTDNTIFNTYTSDTQTILNSKVSGATNLTTTGLFAQKNGDNLEFKGITSTGGSVTITNDSTRVNVEIPIDTNTFVTGFTYNDNNTFTIFDNLGSAFTSTINQVSGLTVNGTLSATTLDGSILLSGGTNLLTIIESLDTYVTGGTVSVPATDNSNDGTIGLLYKNSEGVPHTLPFEDTYTTGSTYNNGTALATFDRNDGTNYTLDLSTIDVNDTFVTGTTFGSNQATVTRNDGTDVLFLTGGTNVTLSNPSSNQIKIDVSSSSSIDTGNVLWVDNVFGDDGTALVDRQDKPWEKIATAIGNAVTNDTIMVRPGEYVESPFTLVPSTSLVSQGGAKVTFISAATPTGNFITVSGSSYMEGFTIYTPTDDSAALYFNDSTAGIVTSFHNVHFKGSSTTPGPLGKGIVMDTGLASNGKIIYSELRYAGGNLDRLVEVNKGIFALDGMHVPGGGTITTGIQGNGGRLQLINVNIGNPLCGTALSVSGTSSNKPTVAGFGFNIFNVPTGIEITSDDYNVEVQSGRLEAGTTNVLVSSGVTGSNGKLNLTGFVMDSTKLSIPYGWVDSEHTFQFSDLGGAQNLSPILRSWSNFEVGHANKGFETNLGRGSEYQNGIHVITSGASGPVVVTTTAKTEGDLFSFQSLTAGEQIYLGSSQKYTSGDYLNFNGFEVGYTGSTGGTYTIEYYSGGTWVDIKYQVVHHNLGYNYSNTLFSRNVRTLEDVRFGVEENNGWSATTIDGQEAKWIRITMVTPPSSLPQIDLVWLEPSHTEVNDNGILNFYGNALYRDTLVSAGNIFGLDGAVTDASVAVGSTVTWNHIMENSQFNLSAMMAGLGDAIMLQTILPKGTCTAYPLRIIVHYILANNDSITGALTTLPQITLSVVTKETYNNFTSDPTGGITPTRRTLTNTNDLTTGGEEVDIDLGEIGSDFDAEYLSVTDEYDFDISSLYESDGLFIRISFEDEGVPEQTITFPAIEASIVKWALGDRIRVE